MKKIVIDASVALSWLLPGEENTATLILKKKVVNNPDWQLFTPSIFWCEIANTLWVAVKRKRINEIDARIALNALMDFDISVRPTDPVEDLDISIEENIAVYDSSYLSLANNFNAELWTLDKAMVKIAKKNNLEVKPD